jgi:hypothetical protein
MLRPTIRRSAKREQLENEVYKAVRALENETEKRFIDRIESKTKEDIVESSVVAYLSVFLKAFGNELSRKAVKGRVSVQTINDTINEIIA